ncbi:peptidoglycan-binding protein [Streptomyces sp. NPDC088261]|uniref:peptidoglycan-binding domain-containing protein n=1 Tax=Streptomyces sp. NPDC088261 TaxID=3365851 RepID=UPI003819FCCD
MTALQPLDFAALPLVLAGPVLRRVDSDSVTVWLALKEARKVTLDVFEGANGVRTPADTVMSGTRVTTPLGPHLHLVAVTARARPAAPPDGDGPVATSARLRPGTLHRYALRFGAAGAPGADVPADAQGLLTPGVIAATADAARGALLYPGVADLPGFVTPPEKVSGLRLFHTSDRKPHGAGKDALTLLDQILKADASNAERRPQQLFLTGDQIYADDVADALLHLCTERGRQLLGRDETFPGLGPDQLRPGFRQPVVRDDFKLSTTRGGSHLLRFGEFAAMYLLAWSDVLWPVTAPEAPKPGAAPVRKPFSTDQLFRDVHPGVATALGVPVGEKPPPPPADADRWAGAEASWTDLNAVQQRFTDECAQLESFRAGLPAVRRALANVPTYTVLDDHEVSDNWFATAESVTALTGSEHGRRLLGNGLAAYAVCQAWGNTPGQFEEGPAGEAGRALLEALAAPDHTAAAPAAVIARRTGVPQGLTETGEVKRTDGALAWHYRVTWTAHQALVLDTRTHRVYPGGPQDPAALLMTDRTLAAMVDGVPDNDLTHVTLLISAAPVVGHPFLSGFATPAVRGARADASFLVDVPEGWGHQARGFEALIARLLTGADAVPGGTETDPAPPAVRRRRIVALSGDVGFGYAARLSYEATAAYERPGTGAVRGVVAQLTGGAARGEDADSLFLHRNGFDVKARAVPSVRRVAWANPGGAPVDAGKEPDAAHPGTFLAWRPKGSPAVAAVTGAHQLTRTPEWAYQVDFYRHEDRDRLNPRKGTPQPVGLPREEATRRQVLAGYVRAARNHSGYKDLWGEGKQLVGRNNLGEVQFTWRDGDAKSVVQSLWWHLDQEPTGAPLTRLSVPLDIGQAPSLPVEDLPVLYHDRTLEEGDADRGEVRDVAELQKDLQELGFLIVRTRDGGYGRFVRWAVRELQTYAKGGRVARVASAFTRLRTAATGAGTTLLVDGSEGFPAAPFVVRIGYENVLVNQVAGSEWTVQRAQHRTAGAEHPVGEGVTWLPYDTSVDESEQWYGYASALESVAVPEERRYTGHVSGVVDAGTREIIARWKANRWRCPVVVEVWHYDNTNRVRGGLKCIPVTPGGPAARLADNVWHWDDSPEVDSDRASSRDFSDRWNRPAGMPQDDSTSHGSSVLGSHESYNGGAADLNARFSGPNANAARQECWSEAEITPERLMGPGHTFARLTPAETSTFKVIRAVSEVEAMGFFDGVNAHDNALASLGLCHWTMGRILPPEDTDTPADREYWKTEESELWAFFAYLKTYDRPAYDQLLGVCGVAPDREWTGTGKAQNFNGRKPPRGLWQSSQRKFVAYGTATDRNGAAQPLDGFTARAGSPVRGYGEVGELEYFRTWHWFHRFVMAGRTSERFRHAMWDMARMRVRDLLTAQWNRTDIKQPRRMVAGTTIGDVFRSERTVALILRWHVLAPGNVLRDGKAAEYLHRVVIDAVNANPELDWGPPDNPHPAANDPHAWDPVHWRAPELTALADTVLTVKPNNTLRQVRDWPEWYFPTGTPSEQRARNPRQYTLPLGELGAGQATLLNTPTFQLDTTGLPADE